MASKLPLIQQSEQHRLELDKLTDKTVTILLEINNQQPQQAQQTGATAVKFINTVVNGLNKGTDPFANLKTPEMRAKAAKILAGISVLITRPEQVAQYGIKPDARQSVMMSLSKDPAWFKQLEYIGAKAPDETKRMFDKMKTISNDINTKNTQDLNQQKQELINLANAWQTVLGKVQAPAAQPAAQTTAQLQQTKKAPKPQPVQAQAKTAQPQQTRPVSPQAVT